MIEYVQDPGELLAGMMDSPLIDFAGPMEPAEARQLEAAGDELRRALLQSLNADTPAALGARLERRGVTVVDVGAAVNALIPILEERNWDGDWTIDRLRMVVTNYLETLRDLEALRGGFKPAGQIGD